jgi:hypothetical protein
LADRRRLFDAGGAEDHVHLYLRWRTDGAMVDLVRLPSRKDTARFR